MEYQDIPKDPIILYSFINTKLRDYYTSLDQLCDDMNLPKDNLLSQLNMAGFEYNNDLNQFV